MKTAEEFLEQKYYTKNISPDVIFSKKIHIRDMEEYAAERESKYRELVGAQRNLIKLYGYCLSDHAVFLAIHGVKETEGNIELGKMMRKRITELEKELGLNKE